MSSDKQVGLITENDRIPPQALAVLLVISIAEINFLAVPRSLAEVAGRDAWISTILGFILVGLVFWLLYEISRRFPDKTLVEIAQHVLGKPLGIAVVLFFITFWLARAGWLLEVQSHMFTRQLLPETPKLILSGYMLLLSAYLVRHGIEPMARLFITFLGSFIVIAVAVFALGTQDLEAGRLLPVLSDGLIPVLKGAWYAFAPAQGLEMILMLGPLLTRFRGALAAGFTGIGIVAMTAVSLMALLIMRLGHEIVAEIVWGPLVFVEQIQLPGFSGFRLDPLFIALWSLCIFGTVAMCQYLASFAIRRLFRWGDNIWPVAITTSLLAIFLIIPADLPQFDYWYFVLSPILMPIMTLGIPLLIVSVAYVRGLWRTPPEDFNNAADSKESISRS